MLDLDLHAWAGGHQVRAHQQQGLTSKGVPYEWEVYTQLGETPGVPRLLHKGFQDGFCIMVRSTFTCA